MYSLGMRFATAERCHISLKAAINYTPYSTRMSPENTPKLIGFYSVYGGFHTRHYTLVHGFCFLKLLPVWCIGLMGQDCVC